MYCYLFVYKKSDFDGQKEEKGELETTHRDDLTCLSAQSESSDVTQETMLCELFSTEQTGFQGAGSWSAKAEIQ